MGNSMLKILKGTSMKCMECLNKDKKKKGQILYITGRDDQIATSAKLLDIMHESYGFNADLIRLVTNEYQCGKASFHWGNYRLRCYL